MAGPAFYPPARRFIQGVLLREGLETDLRALKTRLDAQGFAVPLASLERIRAEIRPPEGFRPRDPRDVPSRIYLEGLALADFFRRTQVYRAAEELLRRPRERELFEVFMLASRGQLAATLNYIAFECQYDVPVEVAQVYLRYFWDFPRLSQVELKAWCGYRFETLLARGDNDEGVALRASYKKALHRDPYWLAAVAESDPKTGVVLVQIALGLTPARGAVDVDRLLEAGEMLSAARGVGVLRDGSPYDGMHAREYFQITQLLRNLRQESASPETRVLEALQGIRERRATSHVPVIAQLTGGHHTTDLQRTPAREAALPPASTPQPPTAPPGGRPETP